METPDALAWQFVPHKEGSVVAKQHQRVGGTGHSGRLSESFLLECTSAGIGAHVEMPLPEARVLPDLRAQLWVRASRNGHRLAVSVVLPHQINPETRDVVRFAIFGDSYTRQGHWQQLSVTGFQQQIRDKLIWLRARYGISEVDAREPYVEKIALVMQLDPGLVELAVDDVALQPLVPAGDRVLQLAGSHQGSGPAGPVEFRLDRLLVEGRPFFPRIIPYHGESAESLQRAGVNVAWVPDYSDTSLLQKLRAVGVWSTATPPRSVSSQGDVLGAREAALVPFRPETQAILFWNLGTGIPGSALTQVENWGEQIRNADRDLHRPLMADVVGSERSFSRSVPMLGFSREVLNSSFSYVDLRDWLLDRRKLARPGRCLRTWVQTEGPIRYQPSDGGVSMTASAPLPVEPEQIRLQTYTVLAAGSRGIGFWATEPLEEEGPGRRERELVLRQLNLELQLLEPWLATGTLIGQAPVTIVAQHAGVDTTSAADILAGKRRTPTPATARGSQQQNTAGQQPQREMQAAVIRTDDGLLLLPIWFQEDAQFVPGSMTASNVQVVVPGVEESASAWEVTTTDVRSLARERVTGGMRITIPKFQMTSAVVLTSDRRKIEELRKSVERIASSSARTEMDLADEKLKRVRLVDAQLTALGVPQRSASRNLMNAEVQIQRAEQAFLDGDNHLARQLAGDASQLLRIVQRTHWRYAVRSLSSPVSSPYSVSFQSLPAHWELIQRLGRIPPSANTNMIPEGDFENVQPMISRGWQHVQSTQPGIRAVAELHPTSHSGQYSLRLAAGPQTGQDVPRILEDSPVAVTTAHIPVAAGQIVHLSGWVRIRRPLLATHDGIKIYDSLLGESAAIRMRETRDWQQFELIREVSETGECSLTFELAALGEVLLDDLQIQVFQPPGRPGGTPTAKSSAEPDKPTSATGGTLDFLQRIPGLGVPLRRE